MLLVASGADQRPTCAAPAESNPSCTIAFLSGRSAARRPQLEEAVALRADDGQEFAFAALVSNRQRYGVVFLEVETLKQSMPLEYAMCRDNEGTIVGSSAKFKPTWDYSTCKDSW